jgi:8-oxo-dGTP pyrophosphatase MutT (NUDIX family)
LIDRIPPDQTYYKFKVSGFENSFGTLLEEVVKKCAWGQHWQVDHAAKTVTLVASDLEERNKIIHETLTREREKDTFKLLRKWSNEVFPVYGFKKELVLSIERVAAPLFGIVTYGVQLLAYQDNADGPSIWVARKAKTKRTFPNMLDSTVGGSLPTGEQPFECLVREAEEEASFHPEFTRKNAVACGTINYLNLTDERSGGEIGCFSPEVQFVYEMKIPRDLIPTPGDNEAEEIKLMTVPELKEALAKGEFTPANGCIILDLFIRHGILTFENEPNYIEIASRLHRVLDLQTA